MMATRRKHYDGKLKKGDRITAYHTNGTFFYSGTVFTSSRDGDTANIIRDDHICGYGSRVSGYGNTWQIKKEDEKWVAEPHVWSTSDGYIVLERITNWKERMMGILK